MALEGQKPHSYSRLPKKLKENGYESNPDHVAREIEVGKSVPLGSDPRWGHESYTSYVCLRALGVLLAAEDEKDQVEPVWLPGVSMRYDSYIPRPLQLLGDFGLAHSVRIKPFDDFGNNRRTVFETEVVTKNNEDSYDATLVKPAMYVITKAFESMPDSADYSGFSSSPLR